MLCLLGYLLLMGFVFWVWVKYFWANGECGGRMLVYFGRKILFFLKRI